MINNELLWLIEILNSEFLWLYIILVIVAFYAIISLLTWSLKKPLMFLGIPTIIAGIILIILRFSINFLLPNESLLKIINSAIKPLFTIGIICTIIGIVMIVGYITLNKIMEKKKINNKTEV